MKLLKILALSLIVSASCFSVAYANLLITPQQVVMEGRERSATITLINNSDSSNTYRLLWEQFVQVDELGGYAPLADAEKYNVVEQEGSRHLKDFAVFTPRQITLAPGEKQTVRIAVRRPSDLADGEHKSHLKFQVIPNSTAADFGSREVKENEVNFGARVNASFSIPVVYRSGDYDIAVKLGQPSFERNAKNGTLNIAVPVARSGMHGVIGSLEAYYAPNGGSEALIGSLGNANLFPEISTRKLVLPTSLTGLNPGTLRLVFHKAEGQRNNYVVMDELVIPVAN